MDVRATEGEQAGSGEGDPQHAGIGSLGLLGAPGHDKGTCRRKRPSLPRASDSESWDGRHPCTSLRGNLDAMKSLAPGTSREGGGSLPVGWAKKRNTDEISFIRTNEYPDLPSGSWLKVGMKSLSQAGFVTVHSARNVEAKEADPQGARTGFTVLRANLPQMSFQTTDGQQAES